MKEYKLIALDMDGTLLNEEKEISDTNKKAISEALDTGIAVIISTGRGVGSAMPYIEELGLQTPIVTVNGSEVWRAPHDLLRRVTMEAEEIAKMHALALRYDTWYWAYAVEGLYNKENWTGKLEGQQWLKFGYYTEDMESLTAIRQELERWDSLEITNSHPCNIELNPKGISKASGVAEVCRLLGIEMSEVIAMGDSLNDMTMIRAAGLGVAMGNAQEELKLEADLVTLSNDEHGVAEVIRKYVLKA